METIWASQLSYSSSPSISFLPTGSFRSACKNTPISSGRRHLLLPLLTQMNLPMPSLLRSLSFYSPLNLLECFVLSFLRRYFLKVTPCQANCCSQWYYSDSSGGKTISYFLYCAFLCFPNFYEFTQVRKLKKFFNQPSGTLEQVSEAEARQPLEKKASMAACQSLSIDTNSSESTCPSDPHSRMILHNLHP